MKLPPPDLQDSEFVKAARKIVEDMVADVAKEESVTISAAIMLDKITETVAEMASDKADPAKIDALVEVIKDSRDDLLVAIVENTPEEESVDAHGLKM